MPSYAQALADPDVPLYWLLEVRANGTVVARYANADLADVGGHFWLGALAMRSNPTQDVDVLSGRGSVCKCTVGLAPRAGGYAPTDLLAVGGWDPENPLLDGIERLRPADLEMVADVPLAQMRARLWRWPETETHPTDVGLLIDGYLSGGSVEHDGTLVVDVVDSSHRWDRKFPRYKLTTVRFPKLHAEDSGAIGPNILYGSFREVECPIVDTDNNYGHGAAGVLGSVTSAKLDGVELGGESISTQTDPKGETYTRVACGEAAGDKVLTISGTGYKDGPGGFWTGTKDASITHPADQLAHFAVNWADIDTTKLNWSAWRAMRDVLKGYKTDLQVLGQDETQFSRACSELGAMLMAAVYEERGHLTFRALDQSRPFDLQVIEGQNLIEWTSLKFGEDDIPSEVRIKYDWGLKGKDPKNLELDWRGEIVLDGDDVPEFKQARGRGADPFEMQCRFLSDATTARKIAWRIANYLRYVRKGASCTIDRTSHSTLLLDAFAVTHSELPSRDGTGASVKKFLVTKVRHGLDSNEFDLTETRPSFGGSQPPSMIAAT